MEEALQLIVAKSPNAASQAIMCLQAIRAKSPMVKVRYLSTLSIALNDPQAEFTSDERAILAGGIDATEDGSRNYMLRIRLTDAERAELEQQAGDVGMTMSEYARRKIFT